MGAWLLIWPTAVLILLLIPGYISFRRKQNVDLNRASEWFDAAMRDYADLDEEGQRSFRLRLYHFFELQWKSETTAELPSDLLLKVFWHSSDAKLAEFVDVAETIFKLNLNPQVPAIVQSVLASIALAEMRCRANSSNRLKWKAIDVRKKLLNRLDEVCPTLQIEMWGQRFPEAGQKHKLDPFAS